MTERIKNAIDRNIDRLSSRKFILLVYANTVIGFVTIYAAMNTMESLSVTGITLLAGLNGHYIHRRTGSQNVSS